MIKKIQILNGLIFMGLIVSAFYSCSTGKKNEEPASQQELLKKQYIPEKNEVSVLLLDRQVFKDEIVSNGTLVATQKNDLKFEVSGSLEALFVNDGTKVVLGQSLAKLDGYAYEEALTDAKISLKKTLLELEDMMVNRGYDLKEKDKIPKQIYEMAALRSGYLEAQQKVKSATFNLESTHLRAPFSGKIAGVQYKLHDQVAAGTVLLSLIDDRYFEVAFYVTESEIHKIKLNENVAVLAVGSQKEYTGKVVSINPVVEKNGTVLIKASVKNDSQLLEGMKVLVTIQKSIPNQFVVPKSAIVLRQNQEVLFKVVAGKAYWTYVKTVQENKDHYTVIPNPEKSSASLKVGDTIITQGNLNLAHDSKVWVSNFQPIENKSSGIKN